MRNTCFMTMTTLLPGLALGLGLTLSVAGPSLAADGKLTIYTYESFTSEWGPGPKVKAAFEAECGCTVDSCR